MMKDDLLFKALRLEGVADTAIFYHQVGTLMKQVQQQLPASGLNPTQGAGIIMTVLAEYLITLSRAQGEKVDRQPQEIYDRHLDLLNFILREHRNSLLH